MTNRPNTAAELSSLRATLEAHMGAIDRDRIEAKEQREKMAQDISAIRSEAGTIDNRVTNIESNLKSINPVIDKVNGWQNKVIGGMVVLGFLGAAVTMFWEAVREKIVTMFTGG